MKIRLLILGVVLFLIFIFSFFSILSAPIGFPTGSIYTIEDGSGLNSLATSLIEKKIVRSAFLFKSFSVLFGGTKGIIAGNYVLNKRQNLIVVAYRFSTGDFGLIPIKITIREGLSVTDMAKLFSSKFTNISVNDFINQASTSEGYLFPDTYSFLPDFTSKDIIIIMRKNFMDQIQSLDLKLNDFNKTLSDVIKMASIVEEEAKTVVDKKIVAGILWKRISLDMKLQVDSSFQYINGKITKDLTTTDLKIDSPYNTYLYKGLPPTPISNPGLVTIKATIEPTETDYLYFLSDKKGEMHYAKTYQEHLQNKELYLK